MAKDKCKPCDLAVTEILTHVDGLIEKMNALVELETFKVQQVKIHGFTYTRVELEKRINRHKRRIKENADRYSQCCKTGILPSAKISD